jgi:TatD DNase family protein
MRLIDSHCHLDDPLFADDLEVVYQNARNVGVEHIIVPSVSARYWVRVKHLTVTLANTHAAYGLHPMFIGTHEPEDITRLERWVQDEKPVAIGECGLDYYSHKETREQQLVYFDAQLALAHAIQLPVIVHARKAVEDAMRAIRRYPGLRGVFHSFSGSYEQASRLMDNGFYLGFGGPVTWARSHRLHTLVRKLPLSSLLLETDAPDQPDEAHRGQRNEPAYLAGIASAIARLKGISMEELAAATTENATKLFFT